VQIQNGRGLLGFAQESPEETHAVQSKNSRTRLMLDTVTLKAGTLLGSERPERWAAKDYLCLGRVREIVTVQDVPYGS
jgi:hypothetical protein